MRRCFASERTGCAVKIGGKMEGQRLLRREVWGQGVVTLVFATSLACLYGLPVVAADPAMTEVRTECIGNHFQCNNPDGLAGGFDVHSLTRTPVQWLGVSYDGDKVRGISWTYFNDGSRPKTQGDFNPETYGFKEITFSPGETLKTLILRDSGYGYSSLRRIELETSLHQIFVAGPGGFDNMRSASGVNGTLLSGFYGAVNPDNFMQELGAYIMYEDAPAASGVAVRTQFAGNNFNAWSGGFDDQQANSVVQWLGVSWDGDKVRGVKFRLFNGETYTEGDFYNKYAMSDIYFEPGETLVSLTLKDSGYGYGSLRRIEMKTSTGKTLFAGPEGFDRQVKPNINGGTLVGFFGLINPDNFIQAMGAVVVCPDCKVTFA